MTEETKEVEEFLSKLGVTSSSSDKQSFRNMYNYVFDPIFKISSFGQGAAGGPPNNNQPGTTTTTTEPEIKAFQLVLRKHFRFRTFPNLAAACAQAEAEFTKAVAAAVASRSRQMTADELKTFEAKLRAQIQVQKKWVKEVIDFRRSKFHKSAREDAVEKFQAELLEKFDFSSNKFYDERDMKNFSEALETKIVDEFSKEISRRFKNKVEIHEGCVELRKEFSQRLTDAIQKSKKNEGDWNQKTETAVANFNQLMEPFLKKHPFAKKEAVDTFRAKAKAQVEEMHGLCQFVTDPVLKSAWDAMVEEEYRSLVELAKAEGDRRMKSSLETVKATVQKAFRQEFSFELEGGELDRMFSQVPEIARRNLEKAAESTTTPVQDNLDDIEDAESGARDDDGSSIISNNEGGNDGDIVESSSSQSSQSFIGVSHSAYDNGKIYCKHALIFPAKTRLPSDEFRGCSTTVRANQQSASVKIYEDVSHPPAWPNRRILGVIHYSNIPRGKRGASQLDYTMKVDALGLLHVEWKVRGFGKKQTTLFKTVAWKEEEENPSDEASQGHRRRGDDDDGRNRSLSDIGVDTVHYYYAVGPWKSSDITTIIPANTKLPSKKFRVTLATEKQTDFTTCVKSAFSTIYEDASPNPRLAWEFRRELGKINWTDIPAVTKSCVAKLDFMMQIDALGLLHVEWKVLGSGGGKETAQFKTSAWQGNGASAEAGQGSESRAGKSKKRFIGTGSSLHEDGKSSCKKAKFQVIDSSDSDMSDSD